MSKFHRAAAGIDHLERLGEGASFFHRLHPACKSLVTLIYIGLVVSMPNTAVSALIPFALYPALVCAAAGVPVTAVLSRLPAALPFALAGGISNLILMKDAAFVLGGFEITRGMLSFCSIMIKTVLSVSAALLLIAVTPFSALAACLTAPRFLRPLGLQLTLTYRYIGGLLDEARDMWTAYSLRAPDSRAVRLSHFGSFLGQLLLRSFDRAQSVYYAMLCRGFTGVYHSSVRAGLNFADILYAAAACAAFVFLRMVNVSVLLGRIVAG
ncbi:MAG: energy-coupling factor transporter transmembrane protein EcfT [Spirochaetaceae bacterium]|jgi:cobalt/nickel transport system permease protein|nr:energy-coupling factor transporter transmembrane protein EcfT [Spirochaetaceae bacterium]